MPYINDRLEANRTSIAKAQFEANPVRLSRFKFEPEIVASLLKKRIIGQAKMYQSMSDMLYLLKADIGYDNRPLGVVFFFGPTGVGKTETVRVIAEGILGSANKICRIDMNTLSQEHYSASIVGSPPGYVGSRENYTLFDVDKIKGTFSAPGIVLFDEIEKASNEVIRTLLNIMDTGSLTLSSGLKKIDFTNTLIFMTSNVGAKNLAEAHSLYQPFWRKWRKLSRNHEKKIFDRALLHEFDPEFINRIDYLVQFEPVDLESVNNIVQIQLEKLNHRLLKRGVSAVFDSNIISMISEIYDRRFGARDLARIIRKQIEPSVARAMMEFPDVSQFKVSFRNEKIIIDPQV